MQNAVCIDSGPLVALYRTKQTRHEEAKRFIGSQSGPLVTSFPVITEVVYLLSFSLRAQRKFLAWAHETLTIDEQTSADLPRIVEIMAKYEDLPADFADASLLALCERRGIEKIASFDKDFDVYRTKSRKQLKNVLGR
jgi:uncharacterized protein